MKRIIENAKAESKELEARIRWEFIKYKIRESSQRQSIEKIKKEREARESVERELKRLEADLPQSNRLYQEQVEKLKELDEAESRKLIFRSKCKYVEEGEKCTKYFLRRIDRNKRNSTITQLNNCQEDKLMQNIEEYYKELYSKGNTSDKYDRLFLKQVKKISSDERDKLDTKITIPEMYTALNSMKPGKAPGTDGLTASFYKKLWHSTKKELMEALETSLEMGELTISQKKSVIRLIEKKGKDKSELKNWRPISLMNVDTKIFSKVLANRLNPILSNSVGNEQKAFLKERNIHEGIRNIDTVIKLGEQEGRKLG